VTFFLQDGLPRHPGDPVLVAFLLDPAVFTYAPGVDVHTIFDVSAPFNLDERSGGSFYYLCSAKPPHGWAIMNVQYLFRTWCVKWVGIFQGTRKLSLEFSLKVFGLALLIVWL
jgi:hypothetical protein